MSWQDDPVVSAAWQNDPIVGGAAAPVQVKPDTSSYISGIGKTIDAAVTGNWADVLHSKMPNAPSLADLKAQTSAAQSSLPLAARLPIEAAGYAVGPGRIFGPLGAAIGGAGVLGIGAEGALAGASSGAAGNDQDRIAGATTGGVGGALLGLATGGLMKGVGAALSKPGSIDPTAEIARTSAAESAAYGALRQKPIDPGHVDNAIDGVMSNLNPSVETGMSGGMKSQINSIRTAVQTQQMLGNPLDGDMVNSWQRQINETASRERHPTDGIVAGKINDALDNVFQAHGAGQLNAAAKTASQQRILAEKLAEWQRTTAAGGSIGQAPLTEAENFFQGKPQYQTLADLNQVGQSSVDPSWSMGHLGGTVGAGTGASIAGPPGAMIGHQVGYYGTKYLGKKIFKGAQGAAKQKAYQAAYPMLTGGQLTGARQAPPAVGDLIKNLMLGGAY